MAVGDPITVNVIADTSEADSAMERLVHLAERFREVWGTAPIPDRFAVAEIKPGDKVIVCYDEPLRPGQAEFIKARASELLPGNEVIVLDSGPRLSVVKGGGDV